jgi:hypothetical protein
MRRRAPLQMALVRRARTALWIAQRSFAAQHFAANQSIVVNPLLRFSLYQQQSWNSVLRNSVVAGAVMPTRMVTVRQSDPTVTADVRQYRTLHEQRTQSRTLLREIVERTRRLEERVRVEKRLVARAGPSPAAASEAQDVMRRSGPDWWKEPAQAPVRPAAAPAVNVNEIADKVMRQLDQRVTAWRERMGRM